MILVEATNSELAIMQLIAKEWKLDLKNPDHFRIAVKILRNSIKNN